MRVQIGFFVALLGTAMTHSGMVFLKRGADQVPTITWRMGLGMFRELFRCKIWALGTSMQVGSFAALMVTLSLAPVTVVMPVWNSGILIFVFLSLVYLKERLSTTEKLLVGVVVSGLLVLGLSLSGSEEVVRPVPNGPVALFCAVALVLAFSVVGVSARARKTADWGIGIAVVAGTLAGLATVVQKAFVMSFAGSPRTAQIVVYGAAIVVTNVTSYMMLQGALQRGKAINVVPVLSGLGGVLPILAGFAAFSEGLPPSWRAVARVAAISLILVGALGLSRFSEVPESHGAPDVVSDPAT
ncbi:MAG: hypothetical protein WDA27_02450 [Actinomycetota bacterium]